MHSAQLEAGSGKPGKRIEAFASRLLAALAAANVFLIVVCILLGTIPTWLLAWQAFWGTLVAAVLAIFARRNKG
ncbi:MAG: hypothetical protein JTT11_09365 [Candidatus Brockarchaeota archaeon]|nr:hypothetical protein [Candidatus Brockarchaeota archaeon]